MYPQIGGATVRALAGLRLFRYRWTAMRLLRARSSDVRAPRLESSDGATVGNETRGLQANKPQTMTSETMTRCNR